MQRRRESGEEVLGIAEARNVPAALFGDRRKRERQPDGNCASVGDHTGRSALLFWGGGRVDFGGGCVEVGAECVEFGVGLVGGFVS